LRTCRFWHLIIITPVLVRGARPERLYLESTMKTKLMLSLLFASAAFIMPASANWFHNPYEGINRNVGSAPNPTPADIREDRLPIAAKNEDNSNTAPAATKTATVDNPVKAPTQGPAATVAAAAPAR